MQKSISLCKIRINVDFAFSHNGWTRWNFHLLGGTLFVEHREVNNKFYVWQDSFYLSYCFRIRSDNMDKTLFYTDYWSLLIVCSNLWSMYNYTQSKLSLLVLDLYFSSFYIDISWFIKLWDVIYFDWFLTSFQSFTICFE